MDSGPSSYADDSSYPSSDSPLPEVADYIIEENFLVGRFGVYYRAKNAATNELFLLKIFDDSLLESDNRQHFTEECELIKQISHENICGFLNTIEEPDRTIIVFEYCDQTLRKYLDSLHDVAVAPDVVQQIMFQFLQGLEYLHKNGYIHRDLRPETVFILNNGEVKIGDFGTAIKAAVVSDDPQINSITYRPPDILMGARAYDNKCDMWMTGVLLAEMTRSGKPLFNAVNAEEQINLILETLGTPTETEYPAMRLHKTRRVIKLVKTTPDWAVLLPDFSEKGRELAKKLIVINPDRRISATEALTHQYFKDSPVLQT